MKLLAASISNESWIEKPNSSFVDLNQFIRVMTRTDQMNAYKHYETKKTQDKPWHLLSSSLSYSYATVQYCVANHIKLKKIVIHKLLCKLKMVARFSQYAFIDFIKVFQIIKNNMSTRAIANSKWQSGNFLNQTLSDIPTTFFSTVFIALAFAIVNPPWNIHIKIWIHFNSVIPTAFFRIVTHLIHKEDFIRSI